MKIKDAPYCIIRGVNCEFSKRINSDNTECQIEGECPYATILNSTGIDRVIRDKPTEGNK